MTSAFIKHDHSACAGGILGEADRLAKTKRLRFTPVRRRVLEILLEKHQAFGAYDILDKLAADGFGNQPPVVYRALDFLVDHGFAHRIRRLNAFTACHHPGDNHTPTFYICSECDAVEEAQNNDVGDIVNRHAQDIGFRIERMNVEVLGICPGCKGPSAQ